jgi:hypothetical protein
MNKVVKVDIRAVIKVALRNPWINGSVLIADGDPCAALEYELAEKNFYECVSITQLKEKFMSGCWSLNSAFIYQNLIFINQDNGGDEWLTLKQFEDGEVIAFESLTTRLIIEKGELEQLIDRMLKASKEQCEKLGY